MSPRSFAIVLLGMLSLGPPARAVIFTVTKTADSNDGLCDADCSLREAILAANQLQDATNRIDLAPGTYRLAIPRGVRAGNALGTGADGNLVVTRTLAISGAGRDLTILDARPSEGALGVDRVLGVANTGDLTLSGVTITGGRTADGGSGGGVLVLGGKAAISGSRVIGNAAASGGGGLAVSPAAAELSLTGCEVAENVAGAPGGGGLMNIQSTLTIRESTIRDNTAVRSNGGGILNIDSQNRPNPPALLQVRRSTIAGNLAGDPERTAINEGVGGGIYNNGGLLQLTNSTVTENEAVPSFAQGFGPLAGTGRGGGVAHQLLLGDDPTDGTFVVNSTIAYNTAFTGSQLYGSERVNPARFANTLVARGAGTVPNCASPTLESGLESVGGGNLSSDASPCGFDLPTDRIGADPGLAAGLADNGGPTETIALLEGSPAIGAGYALSCPAQDQRGAARRTPCDSGAVEAPEADPEAAALAGIGSLALIAGLRRRG